MKLSDKSPIHRTEVRFAGFLSGGFITAIVVNPPESKLTKRTSVHCTDSIYHTDSIKHTDLNFAKKDIHRLKIKD